ncbi:type II secretion system F family protein [Aeromicrobium sp. YIM 150415]|uniref:type II secretion system F family protein n=1 Tax=Aeromicrobium sp. YIM 150415 TaxID=2803912 RepID=UPI00196502E1|nr:type II secretion system F family protein [Aeromicrobium sp. YIM 150415]MBM9461813.1 type II secretion system F family protein [Aeromicrobium sp. YIM 150415]MBM9463161.1 type II secretion system F family protein [Aeromicrobium sp. YIM 150415]
MGALIGFTAGIGLLLILTASDPGAATRRRSRSRRVPWTWLGVGTLLGLISGLLVTAITGVLVIGAIAGLAAAVLPVTIVHGVERRRRREQAQAWPDAVDQLASAVRAGMSLPESVISLAEHGPEPLREPFAAFARDYQSSGRFVESLELLKGRLADPTGDRVVEALRLAREVGGGDLGRMLRSLAGYIRDDQRTRGELEARQSWTVSGARLAVAAPWLVLVFMSGQREVIGRFGEPMGVAVLVGGAFSCLVAYRLMLRAGRLPLEDRVLA